MTANACQRANFRTRPLPLLFSSVLLSASEWVRGADFGEGKFRMAFAWSSIPMWAYFTCRPVSTSRRYIFARKSKIFPTNDSTRCSTTSLLVKEVAMQKRLFCWLPAMFLIITGCNKSTDTIEAGTSEKYCRQTLVNWGATGSHWALHSVDSDTAEESSDSYSVENIGKPNAFTFPNGVTVVPVFSDGKTIEFQIYSAGETKSEITHLETKQSLRRDYFAKEE